MLPPLSSLPDDYLLTPQEVANIFGVGTATVGHWARAGKLACTLTPGGHRRYRWADVQEILKEDDPDIEREKLEEDATRLYEQGWDIRRVAQEFDCSYGAMRRILLKRTTLRPRYTAPDQRINSPDNGRVKH